MTAQIQKAQLHTLLFKYEISLTAQIQKAQLHTLLSEYEISLKAQDENLTTTFPLNDHIHMYNALMWLKEAYSDIPKNVT